jgi:hypothetical protein
MEPRRFSSGLTFPGDEAAERSPTFDIDMEYTNKRGKRDMHFAAIQLYTSEEDRQSIIKFMNTREAKMKNCEEDK